MSYYYYGFDDRWYGPDTKSQIHTASNLTLALKKARAMSLYWAEVKIQNKKTYKASDCEYIIFRRHELDSMALIKKRTWKKVKILKSDGTIQG